MAAKQKKKVLNKNLILLLTIGGIFLSGIVVFLLAQSLTRQDPEVWAKAARELVDKGEYQRARELFLRAFAQSKDPEGKAKNDVKYLVEAADTLYAGGMLFDSLALLRRANAVAPQRINVIEKFTNQLWELRRYNIFDRNLWVEFGEKYVALEPENPDAMATYALGLDAARATDPLYESKAAELIKKARATNPNAPRVAYTDLAIQSRLARQSWLNEPPERVTELASQFRQKLYEACEPVVQANPDAEFFVEVYAAELQALKRFDDAQRVVDASLAKRPKSPDLYMTKARLLLEQAQGATGPEKAAERESLKEKGRLAAQQALELEPAALDAYSILATLTAMDAPAGEAGKEQYEKALNIYKSGFFDTLTIQNARAAIDTFRRRRLMMLVDAYSLAQRYPAKEGDRESEKPRSDWMRLFLEEAEKRFVDSPLVQFMRGRYEIAQRNWEESVKAYEKAKLAGEQGQFLAYFGQIPTECLALLFRELGQPGESLKYTDLAIKQYTDDLKMQPALVLVLNRAELLNQLDRSQEAVDMLLQARPLYLQSPRVADINRVIAEGYRKLGRTEEAQRILEEVAQATGGSNVEVLRDQGRVALSGENYPLAIEKFKQAVALAPGNVPALAELMTAYNRAKQSEAAIAFLAEHRPKITDPSVKRLVSAWEILFTEPDETRRGEKLLPLIAAIEDPFTRAVEYYNFYQTRDQWTEAKRYLEEAEKLRPDDAQVLTFQFGLALKESDWTRAETYVAKLAAANTDRAGGASYRGTLALAKGDMAVAVRELEDADRKLPANSLIRTRLAQAYLGSGQTERGMKLLEEAVQVNPRDLDVRKILYRLKRNDGDNEGARVHLEAALKINPNDPTLKDEQNFLDEEKDPTKGINRRLAIEKEKPDDVDNLVRLGELFAKLRKLALSAGAKPEVDRTQGLATQKFQRALELAPTNEKAVAAASKFFAESKQLAEGRAVHEKMRDGQSDVSKKIIAQVGLADFYEEAGRGTDPATAAKLASEAESAYSTARQMIKDLLTDPETQRIGLIRLGLKEGAFGMRVSRFPLAQEVSESVVGLLKPNVPEEKPFLREARLNVVRAMLAQRKTADGRKILDEMLAENRTDTTAQMLRAETWLQAGNLDKAIEDLTAVTLVQPENMVVRFTRGDLLMRLRRYEAARDDFRWVKQRCVEKPDDEVSVEHNIPTRSKLVSLYEITEQYSQAELELRDMIEQFGQTPEDEAARQNTADRLLSLMRRTKQGEKAESICADYCAKFPQTAYWPYQYGLLLADRKQHSPAAERFRIAMELSERFNLDLYSLAFCQRMRALTQIPDRRADAKYIYENRAIKDAFPIVHWSAAETYEAMGDAATAARLRSEAMLDAVHRGGVPLFRLVTDMDKNLPMDKLVSYWESALKDISDPVEQARVRNIQAQGLVKVKQLEKALPLLDAGVGLKDPKIVECSDAMVMRAQVLDQLGRAEEAVKAYEAILAQAPEEVSALNNLAYLMATKLNQPQAALKYVQQAVNIAKTRTPLALIDTHAYILYLNGSYEEAEGRLREALSINADYAPALEHLALVLEKTNRVPEARRYYEALQKVAQRSEDKESLQRAAEGLQRLQ